MRQRSRMKGKRQMKRVKGSRNLEEIKPSVFPWFPLYREIFLIKLLTIGF